MSTAESVLLEGGSPVVAVLGSVPSAEAALVAAPPIVDGHTAVTVATPPDAPGGASVLAESFPQET